MQASKAIYHILANGATGAITTEIAPLHVDQFNDSTTEYVCYILDSNRPHDTKSGASTLDEEIYEITLFSESVTNLLSLASAVRSDLDRYTPGVVNTVNIDGVQFLDQGSAEFDDKTRRFDIELRFKFRIKRTP